MSQRVFRGMRPYTRAPLKPTKPKPNEELKKFVEKKKEEEKKKK